MTLIFILFFFVYLSFVGMLIVGWNQYYKLKIPGIHNYEPLLSVIVPARNEAARIGPLMEDMLMQSYRNFEIIVVDDHSTDNTWDVVIPFTLKDSRFKLIRSDGEGKKSALTTAIQAAKGEIIVTTDADCRVKEHWLKTISAYFQSADMQLVFGGVKLEGSSLFSKIQAHEFLSLIGTAASTLWWGFPSMCNAANLAFRKSVFKEVGGYNNNFHIPSGDDEFLMHKVFRQYPDGIRFIHDRRAVVRTLTVSFKEFVYQRIRWAGKWRHNLSLSNVMLAIFIFAFHLVAIALPFAVYAELIDPLVGILLLTSKAVTEWIFLKKIAVFLDVRWSWPVFVALQIVYPFYAVSIGVISSFSSFEWKGRTLKSFTISVVKK